jgi:hypothetical protein
MSDEVRKVSRHARRADSFPTGAKCASCGYTNPVALVAGSDPLICYHCQALAAGKSGLEADHFAGAANSSLTFPLPANVHRELSDLQEDWPRRTLENREGDPFLKLSALLRGLLGYLRTIIDVVERVPVALEALSDCMLAAHGARWWEQPQFLGFVGCIENA